MENNEMKRIQDVVDDFVKWLKEKTEELESEKWLKGKTEELENEANND